MTRVLIIDDDPVITAIYEKQFRAARYEVDVANDPIKGFVSLQASPPDVILLDLNMPFRSGLEWLASVRKIDQFRNIPVIVITGEAPQSPLVRGATESLVTGVLFKSEWDPGAVVAAINWASRRKAA